jgi:pyridoxamine 5'-phosphate oxidase
MESLPRPAPPDPLPFARRWLDEAASGATKNPWAMALASVAAGGRPSVRYVLLKALSETEGFIVFYTNYASRKALEIESTSVAAAALYWPEAGRQLRFEGRVERSPAAESDAYFASRPRASQLNAWASRQSRPTESPEAVGRQIEAAARRFERDPEIARPDGWGGYRLLLEALEFWVEGTDRCHERLRYERASDGRWSSVWLQP